MANPFSLLGEEEDGDDVASLVERIAAEKRAAKEKVAAEKRAAAEKKMVEEKAAAEKKAAEDKAAAEKKAAEEKAVENANNGRGRGRGGHGNFRGGRGGRGYYNQGRGGFRNEKQSYGNNENQGQHQIGNEAEVQGRFSNFHVDRQSRYENDNNNNGFRGQRFGGHNGGRSRQGWNQLENNEVQSVKNVNNSNNGDGDSGSRTPETAQVSKEGEAVRELTEEEKREIERKLRVKKEWEEDAKKFTLRQYEEKLQQKRKELTKKIEEGKNTSEALQAEERKIVAEKEFEGMQLIVKKKDDDDFIKLKSEKEKLRRNDSFEKEKLKGKDSLEKLKKVDKPSIRTNFMYPRPERYNRGQVNGQGDRVGGDLKTGLSGKAAEPNPEPEPQQKTSLTLPPPPPAPAFEDSHQFPLLRKVVTLDVMMTISTSHPIKKEQE